MVNFELSCDPEPPAPAEPDALDATELGASGAPDELGATAPPDDEPLLLDAEEAEFEEFELLAPADPEELPHPLSTTLPAIAAMKNVRRYVKAVIASPESVAPIRLV